MSELKYKSILASILNCSPEIIFLYWKGRVALYAILKALGIKEGDEIILPAFTCVVVPNAILYLGAKPVYVDISSESYNMDVSKLMAAITTKTKVIICQNTFGLSTGIEQILQIAKKYNLFTIEDCTHGFGGFYNGKPNGSYCDAAFYSTQWNKPFSTGIGGFLVISNEILTEKIKNLESEKTNPSLIDQFIILTLSIIRKYLVNNYTYWSIIRAYRFLSKMNLVIGSNRGEELSGIQIPKKYFKDISSAQIKIGIQNLKKLQEINENRKKNALDYSQFLKSKNKVYVNEKFFPDHLFLKYPLLVNNRELFMNLAEKEKIALGDWFLSPIHPVREKFYLWKFNPEQYPVAYEVSKKIVNLPTDIENDQRVISFLLKYIDMVE